MITGCLWHAHAVSISVTERTIRKLVIDFLFFTLNFRVCLFVFSYFCVILPSELFCHPNFLIRHFYSRAVANKVISQNCLCTKFVFLNWLWKIILKRNKHPKEALPPSKNKDKISVSRQIPEVWRIGQALAEETILWKLQRDIKKALSSLNTVIRF